MVVAKVGCCGKVLRLQRLSMLVRVQHVPLNALSCSEQDFYRTRRHFSEKRPAGGRIAPETSTFTKKDVIFQKNDLPEAR